MTYQFARIFVCAAIFVFGKYGYEGLRKRTFGKQAAQQVGDAECHKKSVGFDTCAKNAGNDDIPRKSQNAGYECHPADGDKGFEQIHRILARKLATSVAGGIVPTVLWHNRPNGFAITKHAQVPVSSSGREALGVSPWRNCKTCLHVVCVERQGSVKWESSVFRRGAVKDAYVS
jgi:hypothetical protein